MTFEAERDGLLDSALREVLRKLVAHPDFVAGGPVVGGVIVVRHPDLRPLQRAFIADGPPEGRQSEVEEWLRDQLAEAPATGETVMLGVVGTVTLLWNLEKLETSLSVRFEDASGTFFVGRIPYELKDGVAEWGQLLLNDGFDRAPTIWPESAPEPPPTRRPGDGDLPADVAGTAETIDTYLRTGLSLSALDAAIGTLESCLRRYAWDRKDERFAALALTISRGYLARFRRIGDPSDLAGALTRCRELTETEPEDSAWRARAYALLVSALTALYHRSGESFALNQAIEIGERRLATLDDNLADPELTLALADALLDRHVFYGVKADGFRAKELVMDLGRQNWSDVDWGPQAYDCLRQIHIRTPGLDPAARLRLAMDAWAIAYRRGIEGDEIYRYLTAYARELVAAYAREETDTKLEEALEMTASALGLDKPGETPRLTPGAPHRLPLVEVLADGLTWARARKDPVVDRVDPDGARLLSARQELVAAAGSAAPRRAIALHRLAQARRWLDDRAGALQAGRDALAAWEDVFAGEATAERLGRSDLGTELYQSCFSDLVAELLNAPEEAILDGGWEALVLAEAPKSRLLTDVLGRGDLPVPKAIPSELGAREKELVEQLTLMDEHDLVADTEQARIRPPTEASRRQALRKELDGVWEQMAGLGADAAEYVDLRRGRPLDRKRMEALIGALPPETTVVSAIDTPDGTGFVLASAGSSAPAIAVIGLGQDDWASIAARMWREIPLSQGRDRGETWMGPLLELLETLNEATRYANRLIVTPQGSTRALPWPVIGRQLERRRDTPLSIVVEPALGVLDILQRRTTPSGGANLVAGDPLGDLVFAHDEAEAIGRRLGVMPLIGPDATHEAVTTAAPGAAVIHLAAHARFDQEDPLGSKVLLADGPWTARELIASTLSSELVVLSACESGRLEPLRGDEVVGLSMAILHAGARRVLVTLWRVDDETAAKLMEHFYAELERGLDCDRALHNAALWIEVESGFGHPYYWGGYVLVGDYTGVGLV